MRLHFERQAQQAIRFTWGHGRYLDPWTILHFSTGFLFGIVGLLLALPLWKALFVTTILTTLYEYIEMRLRVIEDWQNSLLDIVVAAFGTWVAYYLCATAAPKTLLTIFFVVGLASLMLLYAGWRYYLRHRMSRR